MNAKNYRVENKENIYRNMWRVTAFQLFERDGDRFIFSGTFTVPGWNATDEQCIAAAKAILDESSTGAKT